MDLGHSESVERKEGTKKKMPKLVSRDGKR